MQKKHKLQSNNYDWYPIDIESLNTHLVKLISKNQYISSEKTYPMRRNIAYSIQYIEFLNKIRTDVNMTNVLLTQNIKSILVHGATIIEAIFFFLVESNGFSNSTNWKKLKSLNTGEYELEQKKFKNEVIVFEKSESAIKTSMTFDQMAKKVEKKNYSV